MMKTCFVLVSSSVFLLSIVRAQLPTESGYGIEFLPAERSAPVGMGPRDAEILEQRALAKFGGFQTEGAGSKSFDLLENSDFLGMEGRYVILPKNSILHIPESRRAQVLSAPEGTLLSWVAFQGRFPALVYPIEVTMKEVSGLSPISPGKIAAAARSNRIAVAVLARNPVSVIAYCPDNLPPVSAAR